MKIIDSLNYYKQSNLVKVVNGEASISEINSEISGIIEGEVDFK